MYNTKDKRVRMVQFKHLVLLVAIVMVSSTPLQAVNVLVYNGKGDIHVQAKRYLNVSGFYLVMQPDCVLILYNRSGQPIRSTATACGDLVNAIYLTFLATSSPYIERSALDISIANEASDNMTSWAYLKTYALVGSPDPLLYPYMLLRESGKCFAYHSNGTQLKAIPVRRGETFDPLLDDFLHPYEGPVTREYSNPGNLSSVPNIAFPMPPELAWKPQASLDDFPYLPAGYFLSRGSKLQTVDRRFALMLGRDCRLQSKASGIERVLWETSTPTGNPLGCELTLQEDGRLVIRSTTVSGAVYWNSSSAAGYDSVSSWILRLSSSDGSLSISNIENPSRVLWSNVISANHTIPEPTSSNCHRTVTWIAVGVSVGVLLVAVASLALFYLCVWTNTRIDPADKAVQAKGSKEAERKSETHTSETDIKQGTNN